MLSPRWKKLERDLAKNKARTILVVLPIAVGIFSVGGIGATREILSRDMPAVWASGNPPSAAFFTDPFDEEFVDAVRGMRDVEEAEGRGRITGRLKVGPDQWKMIELQGMQDFHDIRIRKLKPQKGDWPPGDHEMVVERSALEATGANIGDSVFIETPDGKRRSVKLIGTVYGINSPVSRFTGVIYAYITLDTLEWLGEDREMRELDIIVKRDKSDKKHIAEVANKVRDKIEIGGKEVWYTWIPEPNQHPADNILKAVFLLLYLIGGLSLLLSGFLVINTMSSLLSQQLRQVGIMKAIGARTGQIIGIYIAMTLIYGFLALIVAVPLGAIVGRVLAVYLANLMNIDILNMEILPRILILEICVGLITPVLAGLYPILSGTRVTVRQAVGAQAQGNSKAQNSWIDAAMQHIQSASRPLLLSLRNTFRRKARLSLTLITLTLAGAIFMAVFSVRDSLKTTLLELFEYWHYDVWIELNKPYRVQQLEGEAARVSGVEKAESWGMSGVRRLRSDGTVSDSIWVIAPPAKTTFIRPTILDGRWLLPEDENGVVINTDLLRDEPDIKVGDVLIFKVEGRETVWHVVGIVRGVMSGPFAYANYRYFSEVLRETGRATSLNVVTSSHEPDYQAHMARELEKHLKGLGIKINAARTISELKEFMERQFNIVIFFLLIMAILLAVVGGLGLSGTMSINVLERTREIGVMRAIGASDRALLKIFVVEGILIGMLSWLIAVFLSIPLGMFLSHSVGIAFTRAPLTYSFSFSGMLFWFFSVIMLAFLATYLPARQASSLSVREVLAYE